MDMIRNLSPLTQREWQNWYLSNIHDKAYLHDIAISMRTNIPASENITLKACEDYIYDVMFRRTFEGFNKEKKMLKYLQNNVSPKIKESPAEWDARYFVDFYFEENDGTIIGIQLKPESFSKGKYETMADMERKVNDFKRDYGGEVVIIEYGKDFGGNGLVISDMDPVNRLKKLILI